MNKIPPKTNNKTVKMNNIPPKTNNKTVKTNKKKQLK